MKLNTLVSELRNSLPNDYKHLDTRLLIRLLNQFRTMYIKNEYNKNKTIDNELAQEINFEVKPADQSTISYINTDSRILKSVKPIPKPIKLSHRELILSVRNPKILTDNYNHVTKDIAIYAGNGKFNKQDIFTFFYNDYYYIKTKKENPKIALIPVLSLTGIWENPLDCIPFQYNTYLDFLEYDYPMTDTIWGYIKSNILQSGLNIIQSDITETKTNET
jgi:hypothetical protein